MGVPPVALGGLQAILASHLPLEGMQAGGSGLTRIFPAEHDHSVFSQEWLERTQKS